MHTRPGAPDISSLTTDAYRYLLREQGTRDADGRQCFEYQIDNVLLANTLADWRDGGFNKGAGFNELYLTVAFVPSDEPGARTLVRGTRVTQVRYPVGGIKSPVDGRLSIDPRALVDRCEAPAE